MCCILTIEQYLTSATTLHERISNLEKLIDAMILSSLNASEDGAAPNVSEYQLNDGQMIVRTAYRTYSDLLGGIERLEKIKQMYMNQLNGRVMFLRDIRSLRRI